MLNFFRQHKLDIARWGTGIMLFIIGSITTSALSAVPHLETVTPSPTITNNAFMIIITVIVPYSNSNSPEASVLTPEPTSTLTPSPLPTTTTTQIAQVLPTFPPTETLTPTPTVGPVEALVSNPQIQFGGLTLLFLLIIIGLLLLIGIPIADIPLRIIRKLHQKPVPISDNDQGNIVSKLGEGFDSKTWVERSEFEQIVRFINFIDSGNIALAGPRGIGKTSLLQSILQFKEFDKYVTLRISTPTRYEEKEFVLNLFEVLCRSVLISIRKDEHLRGLRLPESLYQGTEFTWQNRLKPISFIASIIGIVLLWQNITPIAQLYDRLLSSYSYYVVNRFLAIALSFLIGFILFVFIWVISPAFQSSLVEKIRGIDTELADLYTESIQRMERIGFQQTYQSSRGAEISLSNLLKIGSTLGQSLTRQPYTLVGLVDDYRDYVKLVTNKYHKVIICIDELDKVLEPDQAREFLRKIKGVFSLANTYYIVSVSEEALEAFNLRNLVGKDEVDSTFSTVIDLKELSVAECREILEKRDFNYGKLGNVLGVLCGGIPRDLIRFARRVKIFNEFSSEDITHLINVIMDEIKHDTIEGLQKDKEIDEISKAIIGDYISIGLESSSLVDFNDAIQNAINILSEHKNTGGKKVDWIIQVFVRLSVRLTILNHLSTNVDIFENEILSNKFQRIISLTSDSPLEAQSQFYLLTTNSLFRTS